LTTEDLDALIARRDELKGKIDMHLRFDPGTDAPGDDLRDELQQTIGAITTALHAPYEREAVRLRQQRAELAQELQAARDHWTQLRCAHGASQGHRSAALAAGDDASEHVLTSQRLSVEIGDVETRIADLEHRVRGVDSQISALIEAEGVAMISGVSAT
jgi:hypothetical protein